MERAILANNKASARSSGRLGAACAALLAAAFLVIACSAALPGTAWAKAPAADPARDPKVVMVVIDRIGLEDLSDAASPNIMRLVSTGGVALMNARARYDLFGPGNYLVIGSGGRALGGPNIGLAFNLAERLRTPGGELVEAGDVYRSRTGRSAPPGSVVNLYIEEMKKRSELTLASGMPGMLGEAVRRGGKKAAVVGNADSLGPATQVVAGYAPQPVVTVEAVPGSYPEATLLHREAAAIAMDENGMVPSGDVSSGLYTVSGSSASGVETDFARLLEEARSRLAFSDLLVVDMGQTSRVDEQADFYSEEALEAARGEALRQCDAALGSLLELTDPSRDLVMVCTPTPTREMIFDGDLLTPLVISGPGFTPGMQLGSPTTRRTGLVSNYDLAPTALEFLGLEVPAEMNGRALSSSGAASDLESLLRYEQRAAGASSSRRAMVRVYVIASMVLVSILFLLLLLRPEVPARRRLLWSTVLMSILAGPLAYLLVPSLAVPKLFWLVPAVAVASALLALASLALQPRGMRARLEGLVRPLAALSGLTLFAILLDITLGSPLMSLSAFGSDAIMADRYYGAGNLYMGFAVGSALLFSTLLATLVGSGPGARWKRYAVSGTVIAVTAFVLGFGRLGANFGGLLTMLVGGLVALVQLEGGRFSLRKAALVAVLLVVFVAAMVGADILMPGTPSHAGKAFARADTSGASAMLSQISRKLGATWSLTFASIWRLLLLLLVVGCLAFDRRFRLFRRVRQELPFAWAGFLGMAVALPAAWVLNDSGIEAAAAISILLFVPYLLMLVTSLSSGPEAEEGTGIG